MCGIAVYSGPPDFAACAKVRRMLNAQHHRGPDGAGLAAWNGTKEVCNLFARNAGALPESTGNSSTCVLGHNWLAIQDTHDTARQPMASGRYTVAFVGEIYNFVELRAEMEALGTSFSTGSDTEVLLKLWARDGASSLQKLRGMYAFALYDSLTETLFVARDPFGIKSVYFTQLDTGYFFASEIRALHVDGLRARRIRPTAAIACAAIGINKFGHNETLYGEIHELAPGCLMTLSKNDVRMESFYSFPPPCGDLRGPTAIDSLREASRESVRLHLRASRRRATCLSGGLDSTNLTWLIGELGGGAGEEFSAFTINTSGAANSEIEAARELTRAAGMAHEIYQPPSILPRDVLEMAVAIESPNHVIGPINQFLMLRRVGESGAIVVLDGQGGDELLSGYPWYPPVLLKEIQRRGRDVSKLIAQRAARTTLAPGMQDLFDRMFHDPNEWAAAFMGPSNFLGITREEILQFPETRYYLSGGGEWAAFREREYFRAELQYLLRQEDRLGMWFGLECRVPYVDKELVALCAQFDPEFLFQEGWLKYPFRVMLPRISESIRWCAQKRGYWETDTANFTWLPDAARKLAFESPLLRSIFPLLETDWDRLSFDARWRLLQLALHERCSERQHIDDVMKDLGL